MSYEWHLSKDRKEASLIETFVDSDEAVQRLKNHSESPIANEILECVNINSIYCFGNVKKDLIEVLSAWDAKFQTHFSGFKNN